MGYRETWFKANQSKTGTYECSCCHKRFRKSNIDIDHIIPQNRGGTNELWNLQPMCKHCNRSKSDNTATTGRDLTNSLAKTIARGAPITNIGTTIKSVAITTVCNKIGEALGVKKKRVYKTVGASKPSVASKTSTSVRNPKRASVTKSKQRIK